MSQGIHLNLRASMRLDGLLILEKEVCISCEEVVEAHKMRLESEHNIKVLSTLGMDAVPSVV